MNKKFISILLVLVMVMTVAVLGGCSKTPATPETPADPSVETPKDDGKKEVVKLKMSVTTAESSTWVKGAQKFADLAKEKSNGEIDIKVYPNEQLSGGNQGKGIEMLRNGSTDISFHSNIIYSIMDERFGVISLPWLLPDHETADAALAGKGGEAINNILDEIGVVGLGFGENGFRQLTNSKRAVATPEDIAGLKIRVPGIKMYISLYQALETDPIAMNFAEVFTALQQKAIDGQENPTDVIDSSKIYEVQDHLSVWNYSYDALILGINKAKFESLSEEHQNIIREAAAEATEYQVMINREAEKDQLAKFEGEGMTITTLTNEQMAAFQEKVQPVYTEYEPIIGKELIDSFK